jgi:hypothetical protein
MEVIQQTQPLYLLSRVRSFFGSGHEHFQSSVKGRIKQVFVYLCSGTSCSRPIKRASASSNAGAFVLR